MQTVNSFYLKVGVRNFNQLSSPKPVELTQLELPKNATVYTFNPHPLQVGEVPTSLLTTPFYVTNLLELESQIGHPRHTQFKLMDIRKALKAVGGNLLTQTISAFKQQSTLLVNPSPLITDYTYPALPSSTLDRWTNFYETIITALEKDDSPRTKFLTLPLTDEVPSLAWLKVAMTKPKLWFINNHVQPSFLLYLELYKYSLRHSSMFSPLFNKDFIFIFHYQNRALAVHNDLFDLLKGEDDSKEHHGLVSQVPKVAEAQVRNIVPHILASLVTRGEEETAVVEGDPEQVPVTQASSTTAIGEVLPLHEAILTHVDDSDPTLSSKATEKLIATAAEEVDPFTNTSLTKIQPPTELETTLPIVRIGSDHVVEGHRNLTSANLERQYIKEVYPKDLSNAIKGIGRAGIVVTGIKHELQTSILGDTDQIKISVKGIDGLASTLSVVLPVLNEDGGYYADGIEYRLRKQRMELPILKVSPSKVVLRSYYGTLFVTRSTKAVDDIGRYFHRVLTRRNDVLLVPMDVFVHWARVPLYYAKLSQNFKEIVYKNFHFYLDYNTRDSLADYTELRERDRRVRCGSYEGRPMYMDFNNVLYVNEEHLGTVTEALEIDEDKLPLEYAQLKVLGEEIPIGIVLAALMGLSTLFAHIGEVEVSETRRNPNAVLSFEFKDSFLHVLKLDPDYKLVLNSLTKLQPLMKQFLISEFDKPDVYQLYVEERGLAIRYFREFALLDQLFIDDISTRELLKDMGAPTEFKALLLRATDLLSTEQHNRAGDGRMQRVVGNEKLAGYVYKALVTSVRGYKNTTNVNKRKMELPPWEVFSMITGDTSVKPVEDNNPIQYMKERNTITLAGMGGRSGETITLDNRHFDPNDLGFLGEAGTDNGDVGMISFLSASPNIGGVRGTNISTLTDAKQDPVSCYTDSYMLAPGITKDHMPRVSFVNIQNTHNVEIVGAETPYVRTGYEYVFPFKVGKRYAWMALKNGKVISVSDSKISVEFEDGSKEHGPLGIVPGRSGDKLYPHRIITPLKAGQTFKLDDPITYNSGFFRMDDLYPDKLCYVQGKMINVAYVDDMDTYEDSCTLSSAVVDALSTPTLYFKQILINSIDEISEVKQVGDAVSPDIPLLLITDAIATVGGGSAGLKDLLAQAPTPTSKGKVVDIEVYYYCELDELSPSLRALAVDSDARLAKKRIAQNLPPLTGRLKGGHRIKGVTMQPNQIELRYYLLSTNGVARGDKYAFCNQLKTTVGRIFEGTRYTDTGIPFDATFAYRSVLARIVHSYQDVGAYSIFMEFFGKYLASKL